MKIKFEANILNKRYLRTQRGRGYKYIYWINDEPYFDCPKGVSIVVDWGGGRRHQFTDYDTAIRLQKDKTFLDEVNLFLQESKAYKERKHAEIASQYKYQHVPSWGNWTDTTTSSLNFYGNYGVGKSYYIGK